MFREDALAVVGVVVKLDCRVCGRPLGEHGLGPALRAGIKFADSQSPGEHRASAELCASKIYEVVLFVELEVSK